MTEDDKKVKDIISNQMFWKDIRQLDYVFEPFFHKKDVAKVKFVPEFIKWVKNGGN